MAYIQPLRERHTCVEVVEGPHVRIRDTQHRHLGHLTIPAKEWRAFVATVQAHQL